MAKTPAFGKMTHKPIHKRTTHGKRSKKVHGKDSPRPR